MAKRRNIDAESPDAVPEQTSPVTEPKVEPANLLPIVEAPSISPATPVTEPVEAITPVGEPETLAKPAASAAPAAPQPAAAAILPTPAVVEKLVTAAKISAQPRALLRPRHKRYAVLAASVAIAAVIGAVVGAATSDGLRAPPPRIDTAAADERTALQQSVGRLAKEVTTLKSSLDAANKSAHSQIAKISERFDRTAAADITGSISAPQTVPAAAAPTPVPLPQPRVAAVETRPAPARPAVLQNWAIRETRDGYVYVQGNGDVYQVVPGAPLPGLGPVEMIKRFDGRWVVTTPKGIIVSMRDRRFFE